jgi:hypothetical protein
MELKPVFLDTGSIKVAGNGNEIIDYVHLPLSASASFYATTLPDPYYDYTQSFNVSSSITTDTIIYSFKNAGRNPFVSTLFTIDYLLGVRTAVNTTGPRVGIGINANAVSNGTFTTKIASTLTAFTIAARGTEDPFDYSLAGGLAVANTTYPTNIQGNNIGSLIETDLYLESETGGTNVTVTSGSLYSHRFAGLDALVFPPTQSSQSPLYLFSGSLVEISGSDKIISSVLPPTASQWFSHSLSTNISTTSATVYTTVFTISGSGAAALTNGKRYLVNFYLVARSAATGTGFRMRAINGNNYLGTLYVPTSNTAFSIQSSADGNNITNIGGGTWPTANADRLAYGEYIVTKAAGTDPLIQIISETAGTAVTAQSGSVVFYKVIE